MAQNYFAQLGENFTLSTPTDADSVKIFLRQTAKNNPRLAVGFDGLQGDDAPTKIIGTGFINAVQNTFESIAYTKANDLPLLVPYQAIEIWADNIQSGIAFIYYYDSDGKLIDENQLTFIRRQSDLSMQVEWHRETVELLQNRLKEVIDTNGIVSLTQLDGQAEAYQDPASVRNDIAWHLDRIAILTGAQSGSFFIGAVVA